MRGSADARHGVPALHLLHAFATDVGLCIGQVAVDGKSNEITALPELLRLLDLRGRDVTVDALHTQRASAKLLHEAGAHYVMALKGNQAVLLQDVETFLGDPLAPVLEHEDTDAGRRTERFAGHGRVETRRARVSTDIAWLAAHQWPGLAAIGRVDRIRICKRTGATTTDSQLYLLGHDYTPERLLALSRGHWAVENNLHWVLDVSMSEDASLVRRDHGPRNRATLKRVALNAVRIVTGKNSIRHTMRDAVLDMRVLADILNQMPVA